MERTTMSSAFYGMLGGTVGGTVGEIRLNNGGYGVGAGSTVGGGLGGFVGSDLGGYAGFYFGLGVGLVIGGIPGAALGARVGTVAGAALGGAYGTYHGAYAGGQVGSGAYKIGQSLADLFNPLNPRPVDPLILDLDGDGVELLKVGDTSAYFDYDQDGFREKTGWISSDDGFLFLDANENGIADGVQELFGNASIDGFTALSALDSNGDDLIDVSDGLFNQLRVWRDLNQDGISTDDEVFSLSASDVQSISLNRNPTNSTVAGNQVIFEGSYTKSDGSTRDAIAVLFENDRQLTKWDRPEDLIIPDNIESLPLLNGFGTSYDTDVVLTQNDGFANSWRGFLTSAGTMTGRELRANFEDLLKLWTSTPEHVGPRGLLDDGSHLLVVESFFGQRYEERNRDGVVISNVPTTQFNADAVESTYQNIVDLLLTQYAAQIPAALILNGRYDEALVSPFAGLALALSAERDNSSVDAFYAISVLSPGTQQGTVQYFDLALTALEGWRIRDFGDNRAAYVDALAPLILQFDNLVVRRYISAHVADLVEEGDASSNFINLGSSDDFIIGHMGDDTLAGGVGDDTYLYRSGDGSDWVNEESPSRTETDVLWLEDLNASDVEISRSGVDLFVRIVSTGDLIEIDEHFYNADFYGIEELRFADGSALDRSQIQDAAWFRGGDGNDTLYGSDSWDDTFHGGRGNDAFMSAGGSDTYLYRSGDGSDWVNEESGSRTETDVLWLDDLNASDVEISRSGADLFVRIASTGDRIEIDEHFYNADFYGIEELRFADGSALDRTQIQDAAWFRGGDGNDTLYGSDSWDDTFHGGLGSDAFMSAGGSDTYLYRSGDGSDWVNEESGSRTETDVLWLEDLNASDVEISRSGADLFVRIASTGHLIEIDEHFYNADFYGIEELRFADGSALDRSQIQDAAWFRGGDGNDTLYGSDSWDDTFHGGLGNDAFMSAGGSDTYLYRSGDGSDWVNEESGSRTETDVLWLEDLNASDVEISRSGADLFVRIVSTGDLIEIDEHFYNADFYGIEELRFADGSALDRTQIQDAVLNTQNTSLHADDFRFM